MPLVSTTDQTRSGVLMGAGAYLTWGVFPLYFAALAPAGGFEVLAHRIVWSALTCAALIVVTRTWGSLRTTATNPRRLALLATAAVLVSTNWLIYVIAVLNGHVVEAALGYYINPLITVLLGVAVLKERLRRLQWVAIGFALLAVIVLTVAFGRPPWIAFALAVSFALYGLVKNRIGRSVSAIQSLTVETWLLFIPAVALMVWLHSSGTATFGHQGPVHTLLMMAAGVVTTIPLLLFAGAASRIPLSLLGLLQYLTPTTQLALGVLVLGESMTPSRWVGFALIWTALIVLSTDSLRATRRRGRRGPEPIGEQA